jgi:hypothetical protein
MVGRFGVGGEHAQADALAAAEELRRDVTLARAITNDFIANTDALNIRSNAAGLAAYRKHADRCATILRTGPSST